MQEKIKSMLIMIISGLMVRVGLCLAGYRSRKLKGGHGACLYVCFGGR